MVLNSVTISSGFIADQYFDNIVESGNNNAKLGFAYSSNSLYVFCEGYYDSLKPVFKKMNLGFDHDDFPKTAFYIFNIELNDYKSSSEYVSLNVEIPYSYDNIQGLLKIIKELDVSK